MEICNVYYGKKRSKCTKPCTKRVNFTWIPNKYIGRIAYHHDCCEDHVDTVIKRGERMKGWIFIGVTDIGDEPD